MEMELKGQDLLEVDEQFAQNSATIKNVICTVLDNNNLEIDHKIIDNLVIHLNLVISREINGTYYSTSQSQLHALKEHEYYKVAREIINQLSNEFGINIDKCERYFTVLYLGNLNILDLDFDFDFDLDETILKEAIDETVATINDRFDLELKETSQFFKGLALHLFPALARLEHDEQLTINPLADQVKTENDIAYECSKILNQKVKKYYGKSFNDTELTYIALHFGIEMYND